MKTAAISEILKSDLLIVELPENITINTLIDLEITYGYTLLGSPDDIKEEDARPLVEKVMSGQHFQNYNFSFKDGVWNRWVKTAKESLLSAIETKVYWSNPYNYDIPERHCDCGVCKEFIEGYDKDRNTAESRTFDRKRSIILKKH